ncbi:MAG TPA: terminase TerL endonuclease subunit [Pirellulales bacterium]|jgi:phage terminase large subunit-like protein|nr:terminase TerL endonuclease subunit [Pirellulales bacterium]
MNELAQKLAEARAAGWAEWIRGEADEQAVLEGCTFDLPAAERVRDFFVKFLRHSKGQWAKQPFELLDWQWESVIAPLFGWKRADGTRRFRRGYIEVPKKNGKSTIFSGLSLYLLAGDHEAGAEVYSAAVDRDQASIVFNEAANMVESSPALSGRLEVIRSTKRITFPRTRSFYRALSAEVPTKEGLNAHAVLIDELHAQRSRDLWDTLRYAGASRRQPLLLSITTAGFDRHSICWEQHAYAEQVLSGVIHDSAFFAFIKAAALDDDWTDPAVWRKANPGFGVTVSEDQFAEDCREAQESPAKENSFRRYRLNQWVESETRWLSLDKWNACGGEPQETLDGKDCWGGLDLSSTTDLSAFVLVFPLEDRFAVLPFFWIPEDGARLRERRDRVPYTEWVRQGFIQATPGEVIDYDRIRVRINELGQRFAIRGIAIDRWNATQLASQLEGDGFEMVAFGQGYMSMNAPTKRLEQLVLSEQLAHGGNPVLRWMANNVSLETDAADNWKPSKKRSRERVDGIVALIMGLGVTGEPNSEPTWGIYV